MPFTSRSSWREKLQKVQNAKVVAIPPRMRKRLGEGTMLIPAPLEIENIVRQTPRGKLVTSRMIRERLAREHGAGTTCPLVTGIFLRITAEAAEEERRSGRVDFTPYWRVVREDGSLIDGFPGAPGRQSRYLRAEGFTLIPAKGKHPPKVEDFERHLVMWHTTASSAG